MKDNLENELECIMPNILIFSELEVKEFVIKKHKQSLTSGASCFVVSGRYIKVLKNYVHLIQIPPFYIRPNFINYYSEWSTKV